MRLEHFAYCVPDPVAAAKWWCDHLDFKVVRSAGAPTFMHFIADASGSVLIELYNNPKVAVPDYFQQDALIMHIAFTVDDVAAWHKKLLAAGATEDDAIMTTPAGDEMCMLRDPWGVPIQFITRAEPMI